MKLACVVIAHRGPAQVAELVRALRHPDVRVYLHVDARVDVGPFEAAVAASDVVLLQQRPTRWAGPELVDVALDGLRCGVTEECGYFVLISGQDFPLKTPGELLDFATEAGDRSYVRSWPLPYSGWRFEGRDRTDFYTYSVLGRRETCIPRGQDTGFLNLKGRALNQALRLRTVTKPARGFPSYAKPHGGEQWFNLSRAAADYVLDFVTQHPDYRRYHEHTLAPDELFFQSILLGTDYVQRHEIVNDSLRFTVWPEGERHPRVLTHANLPDIRRSNALFARKFDPSIDAGVLHELRTAIGLAA